MHLLDLPPELLLECVAYLSVRDVLACFRGNRQLHAVLASSAALRYRLLQAQLAVVENPHHPALPGLVAAERLALLEAREERWMALKPLSRHTLGLEFENAGIYDVTGDYFLVGDVPDAQAGSMCRAIKYVATAPADDGELPEWRRIWVGKPIVDFGMAVEELDLIAVVTSTPAAHPLKQTIAVQLLSFSTGQPHPHAAQPEITLNTVLREHGRPGASVEIVGRTLAVSFLYWSQQSRDADLLYILDWHTGAPITPPQQVYNTGVVFLTPTMLLVPNALETALDVVCLPQDGAPSRDPVIHSFRLPALQDGHGIYAFQCRGEPNPRTAFFPYPSGADKPGSRARPRGAFLPAPEDNLILITFTTGSEARNSTRDHLLVLPRARFVAGIAPLLALSAAAPVVVPLDVPWAQWGPRHTRWLDARPLAKHYITTTCGMRLVAIRLDARRTPAPARVLSFARATVDAYARQLPEGGRVTATLVPADDPQRPPEFASLAVFAEAVHSALPYVEVQTAETFAYDTLIVNNESLVGVTFGADSVAALEVMYFG
ncbi:hypothetical protein MIND_00212100 [Mycena indigotica]|uniref:F-box domain-containing protein n=1 Tax=Mycena indigotica TaxID=2126181 RepID=A0A8H6WBN5_9AGAR|nr:uncharacterized protein MIND_00212100 [Mycena indigotica]KAF7312002.1 hypothetical protein MIND_00212100 [Mycena indigotica]